MGLVLFVMAMLAVTEGSVWLSETNYDQPWDRYCPDNNVVFQLKSHHHNHYEDRQWKVFCHSGYNLVTGTTSVTGYVNNWDDHLIFNCQPNYAATGLSSYHDNHREDRRWRFRCTKLVKEMKNCKWSNYINGWDGKLDWSLPNKNNIINGFHSLHDNHKEDRIWKVYSCEI